jgi:energy-coupling factor transport system ATP-binding protein
VEIAHHALGGRSRKAACPVLKEEAFSALKQSIQDRRLPPAPNRPEQELGEVVISVQGLEYAYLEGKPVLQDVSFDIRQGEFLAIIGANGSGKSTLVGNLIGLLRPEKGKVTIEGQDTHKTDVAVLARDIGYVFQNPDHQLFNSTVAEEVGFSLRVKGTLPAEAQHIVDETLEIVGLTEYRDRHPFSLSRGQRQKLAVATALVHQPRIMLLDEPTTGQDWHSLQGLLDMMVRLNRQGNTTVMVTHDMDIVAGYATRVIVMAKGKIVLDGQPEEVFYDHYDELNALNLRPPTVIDFCRRLQDQGFPRFMTSDELAQYVGLTSDEQPQYVGLATGRANA